MLRELKIAKGKSEVLAIINNRVYIADLIALDADQEGARVRAKYDVLHSYEPEPFVEDVQLDRVFDTSQMMQAYATLEDVVREAIADLQGRLTHVKDCQQSELKRVPSFRYGSVTEAQRKLLSRWANKNGAYFESHIREDSKKMKDKSFNVIIHDLTSGLCADLDAVAKDSGIGE